MAVYKNIYDVTIALSAFDYKVDDFEMAVGMLFVIGFGLRVGSLCALAWKAK